MTIQELSASPEQILELWNSREGMTAEATFNLGAIEEDIYTKLRSLEKELSSREQALLSYKQDRISNIVFVFTIISLAGVTAALVALTPLEEQFEANQMPPPIESELLFVVWMTCLVIGLTVFFGMKSYGLRQKIRRKSEELRQTVYRGGRMKAR